MVFITLMVQSAAQVRDGGLDLLKRELKEVGVLVRWRLGLNAALVRYFLCYAVFAPHISHRDGVILA